MWYNIKYKSTESIELLETVKMDKHQSSYPPRSKRKGTASKKKKSSFWQELLSTVKYIFVLSVIFFITQRFFFAPVMVDGDSMEPTLSDGDYLLLNKVSDVERFDIIVFPPPDEADTQYIKRVIGMPGDTVEYRQDVLYVNGEPVEEPFLEDIPDDELMFYVSGNFSLLSLLGEEEVPEGHYFVLGDNRMNSRDSRSFGFVNEEKVLGKVSLRYWPLENFGRVE